MWLGLGLGLGLELGLGLLLALGGIIFVGQHECGMQLREGKACVWLACMTRLEKFRSDGLSEMDQRDFSTIWLLVIHSPLVYGMAPQQRIHHPPPRLYCPVKGCHKRLQSKSGFTQHVQARHRDLQPVDLQPQTEHSALSSIESDHSSLPPPEDLGILDAPHLSDFHDAGDWETFDFTVGSAERCYVLEAPNSFFTCLLILSHHVTCSHPPFHHMTLPPDRLPIILTM